MNRRNFLALFSAGVAGIALDQAIPLGRVWSFPKKIVIGKGLDLGSGITLQMIRGYDWYVNNDGSLSYRECWRRDVNRGLVLRRTERFDHETGVWEVLSDWKPTLYAAMPFATAVFPPDNFHTPS